jgi:hypothetical protein
LVVESLLYVVAGVIGVTGFWLIINGYRGAERRDREQQPDLAERLLPYHREIADEAEAWLTRQE